MPETTAKAHTSCTARLVIRITRGKFIMFCRIAIKLRRDVGKGIKNKPERLPRLYCIFDL